MIEFWPIPNRNTNAADGDGAIRIHGIKTESVCCRSGFS